MRDRDTAAALRPIAQRAANAVSLPVNLRAYGYARQESYEVTSRAGVGPRGAFAQVIMRGPRAVAIEFGTRTRPALAPLRRALFGMRG